MFLLTGEEYAEMLKNFVLSVNQNPELIRQLVSESGCRNKEDLAHSVVNFCKYEIDALITGIEAYDEKS